MGGLTETLAGFIAGAKLADAPPAAIEKSKKVLADTFAAILAGAGSEAAPPLLRYIEQSGARGESPILGTSRRTSPEHAALANGTFGHALDFDDVLPMMPGHPSAIIVAAALAGLPRAPLSGRELIEAHVIGIETGAKIGSRSRTAITTAAFTAPARSAFSRRSARSRSATRSMPKRSGPLSASPLRWQAACAATSER